MTTLKSLVCETTNIKNEIVECRGNLSRILESKNIQISEDERIIDMINKVNQLGDNKYYLYKYGNEYVDRTGGWNSYDGWTGGGKFNEWLKNSDHLYVGEIYDCIGFICESIDFTMYNKICVEGEIITNTDASSMNVYVKDAYPYNSTLLASAGTKTVGKNLITVDISKVSGIHKLGIESYTGTTTTAKFEFKVYKVWLEI